RAGHRAVHDHNVRRKAQRQLDSFVPIAGFPDALDVRVVLEQATESTPDERVVIGEKYGDLIRHVRPCSRSAPACERASRPPAGSETRSSHPAFLRAR